MPVSKRSPERQKKLNARNKNSKYELPPFLEKLGDEEGVYRVKRKNGKSLPFGSVFKVYLKERSKKNTCNVYRGINIRVMHGNKTQLASYTHNLKPYSQAEHEKNKYID